LFAPIEPAASAASVISSNSMSEKTLIAKRLTAGATPRP